MFGLFCIWLHIFILNWILQTQTNYELDRGGGGKKEKAESYESERDRLELMSQVKSKYNLRKACYFDKLVFKGNVTRY